MKSVIVAILAAVAMAAPATEVETRQAGAHTVQACACANAAGQTTLGACLYGNGGQVSLDGQSYCYPSSVALESRTPGLFSAAACKSNYPLYPNSVCKTVKVCPVQGAGNLQGIC